MFFKHKIENEVEKAVIERAIGAFFKETVKEQVSSELVRQLVAEALVKERTEMEKREQSLIQETFNIKRERLELDKIKTFGVISSVKLLEETQNLEAKLHEHKRLSKNSFDDDDITATAIQHTINFIKQCVE